MKIKLTRTDNLFFCFDPHFNHAKLLEYGLDIFYKDVDDMNETIINNWNSVVPKDGVVFVLGDFALCSKTKIHEFLSRLNGTIYFIFGNHDDKKHFDHPKIVKSDNYCVLEVDGQVIIMSHFPLEVGKKDNMIVGIFMGIVMECCPKIILNNWMFIFTDIQN